MKSNLSDRFLIVGQVVMTVAAALWHQLTAAQTYPTRPITLIVPFSAGGPTDSAARTLGAAMTRTLGKAGSGREQDRSWRNDRSHPQLFQQAVGADLTPVPFQGTAPAMTALIGRQVDLLCDQTTSTIPYIKAGSVKLYGVTAGSRIPSLPDTPTLAEGGLKGFEVVVWHGIYAPNGTPAEAMDKFREALRAALKDPQVMQRMSDLGAVIVPESKQTSEGLRSWLSEETARYAPVTKAAVSSRTSA